MSKEFGRYVRGGPPAVKKFDMNKAPMVQDALIQPMIYAFSTVRRVLHNGKINRVRMEGVKPPYLLVCNHNAFYDFYVMSSAIYPAKGIFPAAVDDYIGREYFLRKFGGVPKRKYTTDIGLLRNCRQALKDGYIFGIYAEARYSLCGVTEIIPDAVGQLAKHQKVPVVTFTCRGHHIYDPFWGDHSIRRKLQVHPVEADMTLAFTPEEIENTSVDEINAKLRALLYNDDFRWQYHNKVRVTYPKRAEGLHKVLYQCPHCMTEYAMRSKGDKIFCEHCGKSWTLTEYGELKANSGETEFQFPTDWYQWEREQVKKEVLAGTYRFESPVVVNDLPNSKGFVRLGSGTLVHDMTGFHLKGTRDYSGLPFSMEISAAGQYAVHVEYNYRFGQKKDCIDLNTIEDTWYVFPQCSAFSVTKISLATEEIHKEIWRKRNEEKGKRKA
ncbi:MAG: 1-acyl-sn-glycerol-3-phosphate acyltransferase [Clostridia bacterium]|nr:1-acyl-sn-glycerol-3-phosphate acyltransferase [Clostridia bacterium]